MNASQFPAGVLHFLHGIFPDHYNLDSTLLF